MTETPSIWDEQPEPVETYTELIFRRGRCRIVYCFGNSSLGDHRVYWRTDRHIALQEMRRGGGLLDGWWYRGSKHWRNVWRGRVSPFNEASDHPERDKIEFDHTRVPGPLQDFVKFAEEYRNMSKQQRKEQSAKTRDDIIREFLIKFMREETS